MMNLFRSLLLALMLVPLAAFAQPVDLNSADAATLETVKGIGPARAGAIVQFRDEHGPFTSVDDLVQVPGIGEKSVEQLRESLTVTKP